MRIPVTFFATVAIAIAATARASEITLAYDGYAHATPGSGVSDVRGIINFDLSDATLFAPPASNNGGGRVFFNGGVTFASSVLDEGGVDYTASSTSTIDITWSVNQTSDLGASSLCGRYQGQAGTQDFLALDTGLFEISIGDCSGQLLRDDSLNSALEALQSGIHIAASGTFSSPFLTDADSLFTPAYTGFWLPADIYAVPEPSLVSLFGLAGVAVAIGAVRARQRRRPATVEI